MHYVPFPLIRSKRLLQSCHCISSARITSLLRNYSSSSSLLILHETKPRTPASIPIRFLHQGTSIRVEERNALSVDSTSRRPDQSRVLSFEYTLNKDLGHSLDGKKTRPPSASTGPPKKLSCREVLDAFTADSNREHELYSTIMDMWNILAFKRQLKLPGKQLISAHPNFSILCCEVMKLTQSMSNKFLVCSLYVFVCLEVNQKTRLIQTLLNVCQQRLGTLTMEEASILANSLKMMENDKTVNMLMSGLCLLTNKVEDIKDVRTLQTLMRIAPATVAQKYEKKALEMVHDFTAAQYYNMFSVLAEINLSSWSLLKSCSQKLIDCLDKLSCRKIIFLTGSCCKLLYFDKKLLSAVGDHIMNNIYNWDISQISKVLNNMAFLNYRYAPLLDYFVDKIMQDSESLRMEYLLSAAYVCSNLNHLPEGKGDKFLETLRTALDLHMNSMRKIDLLRFVRHLCFLGLVSPPAIIKLLEDKSLLSKLNTEEKSCVGYIKMCYLMEMDSCSFSTKNLEKVELKHVRSTADFQCRTFLKNYFKDPTLYQENMEFQGIYLIDFLLTFDRHQSKLVPTEVLHNFESSQNITRIAILCCCANSFTLGSLHPNGKLAFKMRYLKAFGFTVVLVPVHHFVKLTETKKVEFLGENIFKNIH